MGRHDFLNFPALSFSANFSGIDLGESLSTLSGRYDFLSYYGDSDDFIIFARSPVKGKYWRRSSSMVAQNPD